jgi:hypothetical protein
MSRIGEELIGRIVLGILGVFVLFFSLFVLAIVSAVHSARQKTRGKAINLEARKLGLTFDPQKDTNIAKQFLFLNHLQTAHGGSERYSLNVVNGDFEGHPVTLFDYHWISGATEWWWAPSWRRHKYVSFIVVNLSEAFPELTLASEGLFSKVAQAIGFNDIDFESAEFSKQYVVRSKDKKFAYDFCNALMIDYLLDQPTVAIEVEGNALAIGFGYQYRVEDAKPHLGHLIQIRSLMPNYLFDV